MNRLKITGFTLLSIVIAMLVIMAIQQLNVILHPLPEWLDINNPQHLSQLMASLPIAALLMLELSYLVGSFAAGLVLAKCIKRHSLKLVLIVGGLLTLAGVLNLLSIPHPLWLAVLTTITYIPCVWLGSVLASDKQPV